MSGSGISWAVCKSAPLSRLITMPAPHHSVFYRPDALPDAQRTASKYRRQQGHTGKKITNTVCSLLILLLELNDWQKFSPRGYSIRVIKEAVWLHCVNTLLTVVWFVPFLLYLYPSFVYFLYIVPCFCTSYCEQTYSVHESIAKTAPRSVHPFCTTYSCDQQTDIQTKTTPQLQQNAAPLHCVHVIRPNNAKFQFQQCTRPVEDRNSILK